MGKTGAVWIAPKLVQTKHALEKAAAELSGAGAPVAISAPRKRRHEPYRLGGGSSAATLIGSSGSNRDRYAGRLSVCRCSLRRH